jgi:hypothetical protein
VAIASTQYFVFGNERTAFGKALQPLNLFFEMGYKLCCFFETILRDEGARLLDIALPYKSNPNAIFSGHV